MAASKSFDQLADLENEILEGSSTLEGTSGKSAENLARIFGNTTRVHPMFHTGRDDEDDDPPLGSILVLKDQRVPSKRPYRKPDDDGNHGRSSKSVALPGAVSPTMGISPVARSATGPEDSVSQQVKTKEERAPSISDLEPDLQKIIYGYQPGTVGVAQLERSNSSLEKKKVRAKIRENTVKKLLSPEESHSTIAPENVEAGGPIQRSNASVKMKGNVQAVVFQQRLGSSLNRKLSFWEAKEAAEEAEKFDMPWYERVIDSSTLYWNTVSLLSVFACIMDIFIMFTEGTGYFDWRELDKTKAAVMKGNIFVPTNKDPSSRSYLSPTFFGAKICLGLVSDVIYILDMSCRFRLVDRRKFDSGIQSVRAASVNYLRTRFARDLFSSLPIYWILIPIPWLRLNRTIRLASAGRDLKPVFKYFSNFINVQVLRVVFIFLFVSLFSHILACCTVMFAWGTSNTSSEWFHVENEQWLESWLGVYLQSLLWAWGNIMNGQGSWSPQTPTQSSWQLLIQIMGSLLYMYIFAQFIAIQQNFNLSEAEFNSRRNMITTFMRIRDVPKSLTMRVSAYFDALWKRKRGMDERQVLDALPPYLRHDVMWQLNKVFINKVPMFSGADSTELLVLNQALVHMVVTPGEFIMRRGEIAEHVYFLIQGTLQIFDENNENIAELFEGSVVGEVAMMLRAPHTFDAMAASTCDLLSLTADDFYRIEAIFPTFITRLEKRATLLYGRDWRDVAGRYSGIPREAGPSCLPVLHPKKRAVHDGEESTQSQAHTAVHTSRDSSANEKQAEQWLSAGHMGHAPAASPGQTTKEAQGVRHLNSHEHAPSQSSTGRHAPDHKPNSDVSSEVHTGHHDGRLTKMNGTEDNGKGSMHMPHHSNGYSASQAISQATQSSVSQMDATKHMMMMHWSNTNGGGHGSAKGIPMTDLVLSEMHSMRLRQDELDGKMDALTSNVQECVSRLSSIESLLQQIVASKGMPS